MTVHHHSQRRLVAGMQSGHSSKVMSQSKWNRGQDLGKPRTYQNSCSRGRTSPPSPSHDRRPTQTRSWARNRVFNHARVGVHDWTPAIDRRRRPWRQLPSLCIHFSPSARDLQVPLPRQQLPSLCINFSPSACNLQVPPLAMTSCDIQRTTEPSLSLMNTTQHKTTQHNTNTKQREVHADKIYKWERSMALNICSWVDKHYATLIHLVIAALQNNLSNHNIDQTRTKNISYMFRNPFKKRTCIPHHLRMKHTLHNTYTTHALLKGL